MDRRIAAANLTVAQILRLCREAAGMTQSELAARVPGLDQPGVSRYESGRQVPSAEVLLWVVDATGVALDLRPARGMADPPLQTQGGDA